MPAFGAGFRAVVLSRVGFVELHCGSTGNGAAMRSLSLFDAADEPEAPRPFTAWLLRDGSGPGSKFVAAECAWPEGQTLLARNLAKNIRPWQGRVEEIEDKDRTGHNRAECFEHAERRCRDPGNLRYSSRASFVLR